MGFVNSLTIIKRFFLDFFGAVSYNLLQRGVAQLVERVVWDHQAAGSSPVTPTMLGVHNANERCEHPVFLFLLIIIYVASRF